MVNNRAASASRRSGATLGLESKRLRTNSPHPNRLTARKRLSIRAAVGICLESGRRCERRQL